MTKTVQIVATVLAAVTLVRGGAVAGDFSPEYQAGLRRTLELRKQRRQAVAATAEVGAVVPYPMPPALIVRQTPERHEEIRGLLDLLRYGSR